MRGPVLLLIGLVLGAVLMASWWPQIPTGTTAPQQGDIRVTVADAYLSRVAGQKAARITLPQVSHVTIASAPPNALVAHADIAAGPLSAPVSMELHPILDAGRVHLQILSTRVGLIAIPSVLTSIIEDSVNASLDQALRSGAQVTGIGVRPQGLDIFLNFP